MFFFSESTAGCKCRVGEKLDWAWLEFCQTNPVKQEGVKEWEAFAKRGL